MKAEKSEKTMWTVGFGIGLLLFNLFYWKVKYDPQIFFNASILGMSGVLLYYLKPGNEKKWKYVDLIISIIIGSIFAYFIKSHNP